MDSATREVLIAIIGVLVLLGGIIKYLLKANFKYQIEVQKTKSDLYISRTNELKSVINTHEKKIDALTRELEKSNTIQDRTHQRLQETNEALEHYSETYQKKFIMIETVIQKLNKDLLLVKSRTKGN